MDTITRRDALRLLLTGATLTAAGVYVPRRVYSFLWANPLALRPSTLDEIYEREMWRRIRLSTNTVA